MAWTQDPTNDQIDLLCEITSISRTEAITRLKANNNDAERAVSEYFDDPTGAKYSWDESHLGADRQGVSNDNGISFNIQGPDDTGHNSAAPTRPPSRTNNRSPLGAPTNSAQEDVDLQRALAESAAESGVAPQESGIMSGDANLISFGPANRMDYEKDQWAMVPTRATAVQARPELKPSARRRGPATPAFLRSREDAHRLGGLISIWHKIPMARNLLLSGGSPARSYGHNSEWWNGQPILKAEHLATLSRGEEAVDAYPIFTEELHRLMAFLDSTERSYGSIDVLAETDAIDPSRGTWRPDVEDKFFDILSTQHGDFPLAREKQLMSIAKRLRLMPTAVPGLQPAADDMDVVNNDEENDTDGAGQQDRFAFLDAYISQEQSSSIHSLYDLLDSVFWGGAFSTQAAFPQPGGSDYATLSQLGEICTIRINGPGLSRPCDVPATLYFDRYMLSQKEFAETIQIQINKIKQLLDKSIAIEESNLSTCSGEAGCQGQGYWFNGQRHGARECWNQVIQSSELVLERMRKDAQWRPVNHSIDQDMTPTVQDIYLLHTWSGPYEFASEQKALQAQLQRMIEISKMKLQAIDDKLEVIQFRRSQALESLEILSKRLTCREADADPEFTSKYIKPSVPGYYRPEHWNPVYKRFLRGVATTNDTSYVCVRRVPDLIDVGVTEPMDQWWRVSYSEKETNPLSVEKTDLDAVLVAAGTETKNPLFVYASEEAINAEPVPFSDALRMFVRADNRSFQNELDQEQYQVDEHIEDIEAPTGNNNGGAPTSVVPLTADAISTVPFSSPAKRKHGGGSSIATIGSSSPDMMVSDDDIDPLAYETMTYEDSMPSASHQEFARPITQPNKLGGIVESLQNCWSAENNASGTGLGEYSHFEGNQPMEATPNSDISPSKVPEMQERAGSSAPFVTLPTAGHVPETVDLMDIDLEAELKEN